MTKISINTKAVNFLNNHQKMKIGKMNIISLVGISNTGKSDTLIHVINSLVSNSSLWEQLPAIQSPIWDTINNDLGLTKNDPNIKGDTKDMVSIFENKKTHKRVGIVTTGDWTDIVSVGIQYLISKNVDIAVIASHPATFNHFILELNPLAIEIRTHFISQNRNKYRDLMQNKNLNLVLSCLI
ncbi:hypothetical protein [Leuconostoc gasicomitatum]|jgi:hypothetical protein|uniref:hypothetical protein n=1 Tax=Leuconostoc gasicomitatum TaxID=115778 RepID=UPI000744B14B|nr:hypothetical protein [Leuconostoc gasicomitatum]MBZ5972421.1 hypothetical protein [Leuconostoc gasicomitatum]CUR64575.1 Uncharacterized protein LEKG_1988 [Leuconostoc gasicomitatum KG16-1]